jgi:hypothetical protein
VNATDQRFQQPASIRRSCRCTVSSKFTGKYEHRVIEGGIGHNLPQEAPQAFAEAIIDADSYR